MACSEAVEQSPIKKFVGAFNNLQDITQFHTDPNIASMVADLTCSGRNDALSITAVRVLEVLGIAKAVATRFRRRRPHHAHATRAALVAGMFSSEAQIRLASRNAPTEADARTPAINEGNDRRPAQVPGLGPQGRRLLRKRLSWYQHVSVPRDGVPAAHSLSNTHGRLG